MKLNFLKAWIIPGLAASLIFLLVRPSFAQAIEGQASLAQYLTANNVEVGSEIGNNGFRQIYYVWNNNKVFITDSNYTNADPIINGERVVWISKISGRWQVFLRHISTNQTTQLTQSGNNVNPRIDNGKVVWEGWVEDKWQVFFYDGKSVKQLTSGDNSVNPDIEGENIIYGRRDITGTWRSVVYSISKKEAKEVTTGLTSKRPKLSNGQIFLADGKEKFPLTVDDLFLLDLGPLSTGPTPSPSPELALSEPETVTEEEIVEELQATPSAILEEATQSDEI